jgi:hypothetical protein
VSAGAFFTPRTQKYPQIRSGFSAGEESVYPGTKRTTVSGITHKQRKGSDNYVKKEFQGRSSREDRTGSKPEVGCQQQDLKRKERLKPPLIFPIFWPDTLHGAGSFPGDPVEYLS